MITPAISPQTLCGQLEILLESDMPVFIHGSPGIGKSYIVRDIAQKRGWRIRDVRLSQLDPVDLRGIPSIKEGRTVWMAPEFFPAPDEAAGILFLDELNAAPPSVQAAVYQLVLERRLGEYVLPETWRIVCAGNRISDRGVVFKLPTPLANRMVHLSVEARFDDFKTFALRQGLHPFVIGFLGFRPDLLSSEPVAEDDANPAFATPRSWHMLSSILRRCADPSAIASIVYGTVGYGPGIEFLGYVKVYETLPDIRAIYGGEYPEVASEPALLYALVSALVEYFDAADPTHAEHLFAFSRQLPAEFCVMLIKDIVLKDESVAESEHFDGWLNDYGDYIL